MFDTLNNEPLVLKHNRIKRAYTGGKLLDCWQGIKPEKDGNMSEEFLISTVEVTNVDKYDGEGLSMTDLDDGSQASLKAIIDSNPGAFLGEKYFHKNGNQIGVLARVGDSNVRLVIQCHPDAKCAREYLNFPSGKSEVWYIVDTREIDGEKPHTYAGFKEGVTREQWKDLFEKQDIQGMLDAMHKIYINKGDVIYVKAGMPHAMGPGAVFLELHEPSDYTLRLERDYLGIRTFNEQEIHYGMGYEKLFDCFDYTTYTDEEIKNTVIVNEKEINSADGSKEYELLSHDYTGCFAMNKVDIQGEYTIDNNFEHSIAIVVKGNGYICGNGKKKEVNQGQGIFIPNGLEKVTFESLKDEKLEVIVGFPPKMD
ncbi:class I mannose-6-phosphate isomerase [Clostridium sediminicola]|uniref:class I mannose-6-phosphate isomerase n=1 Tax=Clostridium sediminicola TaxID=3114879 RepID=UPI0031F1CE11